LADINESKWKNIKTDVAEVWCEGVGWNKMAQIMVQS
jgi:hypothetical protein